MAVETHLRSAEPASWLVESPLLAAASVPVPRWLFVGAVGGVLLSLAVAATFVVASRLFPEHDDRRRGTRRSTEVRRRAEIRRYLRAIDERFREDATVAGRTVAFYLPERDVAVTFDARTFLELERSATHGVLMEHEMPGVGLGHRLPFETPSVPGGGYDGHGGERSTARRRVSTAGTVGAAGLTEADESAFSVLGLPKGADEEAVRRAYRRRIKEVHPDTGGTEAEFRAVRDAYDTARQYAR